MVDTQKTTDRPKQSLYLPSLTKKRTAPILKEHGKVLRPLLVRWCEVANRSLFCLQIQRRRPSVPSGCSTFRGLEIARLQPIDKADFEQFIAPIEHRLSQMATRAGATLIRPTEYLCPCGTCPATDDSGSPIYKDADHLRPASALERATFIDVVLRPNPLASWGTSVAACKRARFALHGGAPARQQSQRARAGT